MNATDDDASTRAADHVSRESIDRINFVTGSSIKDLRNVTVVLTIRGDRYELHFDENGQVKDRLAE